MSRRLRRRSDAWTIGLLVLLVATLFVDLLLMGNGLYLRDLTFYHYPMKWIVREGMLNEIIPHWNHSYSAGEPLAANPVYEVFYPPQWLILLPDFHLGFQLHILAHLILCLVGLYLLLRSLGLSLPASVLGAVSFALGGAVFSLVNILPTLFAVAWIPWILLYSRLFLITRKVRHLALASLFLGLHLIVGEPASVLQAAILLGGYVVWRSIRLRKHRLRGLAGTLGRLSVVALGGVAISAVQVFPAMDFARDTVRANGFEAAVSGLWSMPLLRPIELFFPAVFGSMEDSGAVHWAARLYPDRGLPYLYSIYIGFGSAVLALTGILARIRGSMATVLMITVSYLLAIGSNGPFFDALYSLGLFRAVRFPERFAVLALFVLAIFGATVLDRLIRGDRKILRIALAVSWTAALVGITMWAISWTGAHDQWFQSLWQMRPSPMLQSFIAVNQREWLFAALRAVAFSALLSWSMVRRDRIWAGAFLLFLLADMAPLSWRLLPRMPARFFAEPAVSDRLPEPKDQYRVFFLAQWLDKSEVAVLYVQAGTDSVWLRRNGLFTYLGGRWKLRSVLEQSVDATVLSTSEALRRSLLEATGRIPNQYLARYASISNVHFFTRFRPFGVAVREAKGDPEKVNPVAFVGGGNPSRYYFADRVRRVQNEREFTEGMISSSFTPRSAFVFAPSFSPAAGSVIDWSEDGNQIRLTVEASGKAFLVNSVSFHRYWRASLDGDPLPLLRTNLAYLGLVIPEGRHQILLEYRNPWILPAGIVSLLALLGSVVAICSRRSLGPGFFSEHRRR